MTRLLAGKINKSLMLKIIMAGLIGIAVLSYAVTSISNYFIERYANQTYLEKATTVAHLLDANISSRQDIYDQTSLLELVQKTLWLDPDILNITVFTYQQQELLSGVSNLPRMRGIKASDKNLEAYHQNKIISEKLETKHGSVLRVYAPVHVAKFQVGTIQFDLTLENLNALKQDIFNSMVSSYLLVGSLIVCLILLYIRKRIIMPIKVLQNHVNKIAEGDFKSKIPTNRDDELGRLSNNFNKMADSLEQQRQSLLQAKKDMEFQATHDILTSLPNRLRFKQRLLHNMSYCRRHRCQGALMLMDLDQFKGINDSMGHDVGDQLLVQVAKRLNKVVRQEDMVARLGGDEFVIIISDVSKDRDEAVSEVQAIARNIIEIFSEPFCLNQHDYYISTSIGVVLYPDKQEDINTVIKHADTAMYRAKEEGGNCIRFFDKTMQNLLENRIRVLQSLRESIKNNQLQVYYQPQVNHNGEVTSAEALVRWMHPIKGLLLPDAFIGIAESNGMIVDLGDWVLNAVCQQFSLWQQQAVKNTQSPFRISVNISPKQFHQKDFCEKVIRTLSQYEIPANGITLEITETALLQNMKDAVEKLKKLKDIGIQFSIDDFGTGFSSLAYLKQLPLDELKIDRSFIYDMTHGSKDAFLVKSIITLSNNLGLNVVAEGVESQEQYEYLKENNCSVYQGYLFKEPLSAEQFEDYLYKIAS